MIVTAIKQQLKDEQRVSIFVDGVYSFSLTLDQLLMAKLKKGQELSDSDLAVFKKQSADGKLRTKALAWVMSRPHSVKELKDYLRKQKAESDTTAFIIDDFLKRGYLNDQYFATWFTEQRLRKHKSIRAIRAELKTKGIDEETIQSVVSGEQASLQPNDVEAISQLVNKLRKKSRYQDDKKLMAYLVSKGFRYGDVKEVLTGLALPEDSFE
jgi:regulatory protein